MGLFNKKLKELESQTEILWDEKKQEEAIENFFFGVKKSQWIFSGALILSAVAAWVLLYFGLYSNLGGVHIWSYIILSLLLLSTGIGLSYYLLYPRRIAILTYFIISAVALGFFGWRGWEVYGVIAFFVATLRGYQVVQYELKIIIPFLYARLLARGLPIFFTGLAFTFAVFFNESPVGQSAGRPQIPKDVMNVAMIPAEYAIKSFEPGFSRNMTMNDAGELFIGRPPSFFKVPPESVRVFLENFFAGVPPESQNTTVSEFLRGGINAQIAAIIRPYEEYLSFVFLLGLFFVFRAISIPMMWLSIGTGWIISNFLKKLGAIHMRKVTVEKEELRL